MLLLSICVLSACSNKLNYLNGFELRVFELTCYNTFVAIEATDQATET